MRHGPDQTWGKTGRLATHKYAAGSLGGCWGRGMGRQPHAPARHSYGDATRQQLGTTRPTVARSVQGRDEGWGPHTPRRVDAS